METIRNLIDTWAEAAPEQVFLVAPETGKELTAGELQELVRFVAARLADLGLEKGDKAAFLMDNGLWTTVLFLGAMYAGRVIVPLNAVAGPDQLAYVLEHSDSKVVFVNEQYAEKFAPIIDGAAEQVRMIAADEDAGPNWPQMTNPTPGDPLPALAAEDEALMIYTSGTTGRPKGVLLSHANAIAGGANTARAHDLTAQDRALCVLPLYHINGEMVTVMAPLVSHGSVVMPHRFSTPQFWELISRFRCTWFSVVPTIIAYLLEQAERDGTPTAQGLNLQQLRFGRSASAPLSPDMHQAFERQFNVPVIETMGLSETAAQILSNPMPPAAPKYGSPGIAYGNEAKIVDADGRVLTDGESGELMIRGPNVMKGYYKNPEATAKALEPDGWLHTGDLAFRDADGYYFITGRLKEIIIKGGENIAPREIDEVLYQHPAVLEAAAFPVPDKRYGQEIMAGVVLKPEAQCDEGELETFCEGKLGGYKCPRKIWLLDTLPKGPSGKIQRLKLAELVEQPANATADNQHQTASSN
ncbi:MAG: AMP-binding protein [Gammaproteobacteria bacterium]